MPQYDIRCVVGQKIRWHQIIHHQVCNPSRPCPQLNRINISKKRFPEEETWWYLNAEKCELTRWLKRDSTGGSWQDNNRLSTWNVSREWWRSCDSMKIYKSQSKGKYALVWQQMYGRSKNQKTLNHPSSNVQYRSSISTTELGPNVKEASLRRKSMMISKYQPNLKHLSK